MCGVFGYALKQANPRIKQIAQFLAYFNQTRGRGAWGITNGVEIVKDIGNPRENIHRMMFPNKGIVVGHTRAPSVGSNTQENAHPWQFKGEDGGLVTGCHNGYVANHDEMNKKYGDRKFAVDSMHIFKHLADGLDLGELEGWGSIQWVQEKELYLSKFNRGELSIAHLAGGGIVWSSELNHLHDAIRTSGLEYTTYNLDMNKIYRWDGDGVVYTGDKVAIREKAKSTQVYPAARRDWSRNRGDYNGPVVVRFRIEVKTKPKELEEQRLIDSLLSGALKGMCEYSTTMGECVKCKKPIARTFRKEYICVSCLAKAIAKKEIIIDEGVKV